VSLSITASDQYAIEFTRYFLALFYCGVASFYLIRIKFVLNDGSRTKRVILGKYLSASWWNHLLFKIFRALILVICVLRCFFPDIDRLLILFEPMQNALLIYTGSCLLITGFGLSILVHFFMGKAWYSGINVEGPNQLITTRFYRYSRNPMFVGVALSQIGFFLALPSVFTLLCLSVGLVTLYRQAILEEQHLEITFPEEYANYKNSVPRWV